MAGIGNQTESPYAILIREYLSMVGGDGVGIVSAFTPADQDRVHQHLFVLLEMHGWEYSTVRSVEMSVPPSEHHNHAPNMQNSLQ